MLNIREHVISRLKNYSAMRQELKVLEYELEARSRMLDPDTIEDRILARSGGERVSSSMPGDKTADIVVEHIDRQRGAAYYTLVNTIRNIRLETDRLDYYLSLLPPEEADVIRQFYFDGLSWEEIARKTDDTARTLQRRRKQGLDKLTGYYSAVDKAVRQDG